MLWLPGTFHELPDSLVTKYMDEYKAGLRCRMEDRETAVDKGDGIIKTTKGSMKRLVRLQYPCGLTYEFQGPRGSERPVRAFKVGSNFIMPVHMSNFRDNHAQGGINSGDSRFRYYH